MPGIEIRNLDDLVALSQVLFRGGCRPSGVDSPEKLAVIILAGLEVGLSPTQAIGSIMISNGRPTIYGDGALALVRASGQLESIAESVEGQGMQRIGKCVICRRGEQPRTFTFSLEDAKRAGLLDRARGSSPWATYPDRMLIMRARGFALRDVFPDVLRGLITAEEAEDYQASVSAVASGQPALEQSSIPALPTSPEPMTADQQEEIKRLMTLVCVSKGVPPESPERKQIVKQVLDEHGLDIKRMNREDAQRLIRSLGVQYDPLSYPAAPRGEEQESSGLSEHESS